MIFYKVPTKTPNGNITTFKLLVNSIIFTTGARFFNTNIKDFYLYNTMFKPEYMLINSKLFPPDIIEQYDLKSKVKSINVLAKIVKGMYGLHQAL